MGGGGSNPSDSGTRNITLNGGTSWEVTSYMSNGGWGSMKVSYNASGSIRFEYE